MIAEVAVGVLLIVLIEALAYVVRLRRRVGELESDDHLSEVAASLSSKTGIPYYEALQSITRARTLR